MQYAEEDKLTGSCDTTQTVSGTFSIFCIVLFIYVCVHLHVHSKCKLSVIMVKLRTVFTNIIYLLLYCAFFLLLIVLTYCISNRCFNPSWFCRIYDK